MRFRTFLISDSIPPSPSHLKFPIYNPSPAPPPPIFSPISFAASLSRGELIGKPEGGDFPEISPVSCYSKITSLHLINPREHASLANCNQCGGWAVAAS